jgi:hypothetical protein
MCVKEIFEQLFLEAGDVVDTEAKSSRSARRRKSRERAGTLGADEGDHRRVVPHRLRGVEEQ